MTNALTNWLLLCADVFWLPVFLAVPALETSLLKLEGMVLTVQAEGGGVGPELRLVVAVRELEPVGAAVLVLLGGMEDVAACLHACKKWAVGLCMECLRACMHATGRGFGCVMQEHAYMHAFMQGSCCIVQLHGCKHKGSPARR